VYPWSSPSTSTTIDCAHADYAREQAWQQDNRVHLAELRGRLPYNGAE
jgi:hypothetical protein